MMMTIIVIIHRRCSLESISPPSEFLRTPLFVKKFLRVYVRTVPGNVHVKFKVHDFNHVNRFRNIRIESDVNARWKRKTDYSLRVACAH